MKNVCFLFTVMCFSATSSVLYAEDYDYLYERIYDDRGEKLSKAQVKSNLNQLARNITVRLATIASFKRDGNIYDGNPTQPDIVVHPTPEYFLGKKDKALSKALKVLGAS